MKTVFNIQTLRNYTDNKCDEDIKWQWAVRHSPCHLCHVHKTKRSWISKLWRKNHRYELTNQHKEIKYEPKFWELEYYNYLLPDDDFLKSFRTKDSGKNKPLPKYEPACESSNNIKCEGNRYPIIFDGYDHLKPCLETLKFEVKEPFHLKNVCGKGKVCREKIDNKTEFVCLNDFLEEKRKPDDCTRK